MSLINLLLPGISVSKINNQLIALAEGVVTVEKREADHEDKV